MKKFAELQYVRPDMEKIFARVSGDIAVLKEAKNYEEFRNAYMDYVEADTELEMNSMRRRWYILTARCRNTKS